MKTKSMVLGCLIITVAVSGVVECHADLLGAANAQSKDSQAAEISVDNYHGDLTSRLASALLDKDEMVMLGVKMGQEAVSIFLREEYLSLHENRPQFPMGKFMFLIFEGMDVIGINSSGYICFYPMAEYPLYFLKDEVVVFGAFKIEENSVNPDASYSLVRYDVRSIAVGLSEEAVAFVREKVVPDLRRMKRLLEGEEEWEVLRDLRFGTDFGQRVWVEVLERLAVSRLKEESDL